MNNIKRYNIFILLSTLSRNIPEVYSAVLLYKMDYSLKDILLFFTVLYLLGALTSVITIYILNKIKSKYILILSSIIFSLSFYYMSIMSKTTKSLLIFCLFLLLKLNIYNKYLILIIGLFEGLGIKMFEIVSSENIYNIKKDTNIGGYLLLVELIFCITRSIMCLIGYLINNIKIILYLTIVLIFLVGFVKRDINKDC